MLKTVKILKNLPVAIAQVREQRTKYKTHQIFKAFETFLYLKALTTTGKLHNTYGSVDAFVKHLADEVNVSRNTMYTRLEYLQYYNLVTVDKQGLYLVSWSVVAKRYRIKQHEFYTIELQDKGPKLEHILRTLTIAEHKSRMAFKFAKFIESHNQLRHYLQDLWGSLPQTIEQMAEKITRCKIWSFQRWTESFDFWHSLNADFNASVKKLMRYFSFDDFRQVAYWKRALSRSGLITVQTRKYESKKCTRKANDVLRGGKVYQNMFYNTEQKIRIWQMPDAITINI